MPRRREVAKRVILEDPKYKSKLVAKFINSLMKGGKKSVARGILYDALSILQAKIKNEDTLKVLTKAIDNIKPVIEVKSRRVGGSNYQVPVEIRGSRREALAIRWAIDYAHSRPGKSMEERLAAELEDAFNNRGSAIKKKEDTHKMAEANKAFAHFRW